MHLELSNGYGVLLIGSAVLSAHCVFLSIALSRMSGKVSNVLLAILLIMLAIRSGKSVISLLFPETAYSVSLVGLLGMTIIGPLLHLFVLRLFSHEYGLRTKEYIHFAPGAIALLSAPFLNWYWLSVLYYSFTLHLLVYLALIGYRLIRKRETYCVDDLKWNWALGILLGMGLIAISFVVQVLVYDPITYLLNVVTAAGVVYALSLYSFSRSRLFTVDDKRRKDPMQNVDELGRRIHALFEEDQIFIHADLNVSKLAEELKVPPYLVSKAINQYFGKSFPEFLLGYRLKKAEHLLLTQSNVLSIEGIAYEAGFNSLSVFYSAFKKLHKVTPAEYRNTRAASNMRAVR